MKKTAATNSARSGSFHVEMDIAFSKLGSAMALLIVPMAPTKRIVKTKITRTKPSFQFQFSRKVSIIDLAFGIILFKSHKRLCVANNELFGLGKTRLARSVKLL